MQCGWFGTIGEFLQVPQADWLHSLGQHYRKATKNETASSSQVHAWENCFAVLRTQFSQLVVQRPEASSWACLFEYELPREGGRRPDLTLLAGGVILVFEFKEKDGPELADIDQVSAYAKDLANYHAQSHNRPVVPFLVPTKSVGAPGSIDSVGVIPPAHLATELLRTIEPGQPNSIDPLAWVNSEYAPLPFLVDAARHIFQHDPLPYIKRAHAEAQIPAVLHYIASVAEQARKNGERHLVLLTGAPGAGKTLVGLQFVYEHTAPSQGATNKTAVFLSGNAPLIQVLQYALRSSVFVQDVHKFVKEYGVRRPNRIPMEHVLVFDEAQRAWSRDKMQAEHSINKSEPDIFVDIAERIPGWAVVIGLVGEGQEIHVGEEAGLRQWNESMGLGRERWFVHTPAAVSDLFPAAYQTHVTDLLTLTTSLRTHIARGVQDWINEFLLGHLSAARRLAGKIRHERFQMYVTQSLDDAKAYVRVRYQGERLKRYGLLASSKPSSSVVDTLGVPRDYQTTQRLKYGEWYNEPAAHSSSCCRLDSVVTEFGCQGLELDMPIICWGNDVWWEGTRWHARLLPKAAKNPQQLRLNAYRVLLSRGRDGFIVWVPPVSELQQTYRALVEAGATPLQVGALRYAAATMLDEN